MHPIVLKAYEEEGYSVHIGNNHYFPAALVKDQQFVSVGGGMSVQGISFFHFLSTFWQPKSIYLIGNAFGCSSLNFAAIFPHTILDAIDAEVEGEENSLGSELTKRIAHKHLQNLQLFKGFSPQDISSCRRSSHQTYDIGIIDGYHHPDQAEKDFKGLLPYLNDNALIYYHDAGMFGLNKRLELLADEFESNNWKLFHLDFMPFGGYVLLKNLPEVEAWVKRLQTPYPDWSNPTPTDRVSGRENIKAVTYKKRIYYPSDGDIVFCGDNNINLVRLALEVFKAGTVVFYGAQGALATDTLEFIDNYRSLDIAFIDRALAGQTVDGWPVYSVKDIGCKLLPEIIVVTATCSGKQIISDLNKLELNCAIAPLYMHEDKAWRNLKNTYLNLWLGKWKKS